MQLRARRSRALPGHQPAGPRRALPAHSWSQPSTHGEAELCRAINLQGHKEPCQPIPGANPARFAARPDPPAPAPAASFGASATAKVSVNASLAGAIIGKGSMKSKQICRQTGAKLSIRDHETNPGLKSIELEGTLEQIKEANVMVQELINSTGRSSVIILPRGRARSGTSAISLTGLPSCCLVCE
ncbi:Zinc finger CCCH domain-containing protein 36 [Striga hermonthica]|uniref:Zinc finger CCCH domain-containing protein 36 n=1 Tax=Striga hermonthica TaxID=68872 RepID=A0A9N7MQK5_STRHE|nr:Zinc finger CCCH domain-containing protein 36 [Striga hermonthica]